MRKYKLVLIVLIGLALLFSGPALANFLKIGDGEAVSVAFSNDGRFIAGASNSGDLVVWRISDNKDVFIKEFSIVGGNVPISFSRDSKYFGVGAGSYVYIYRTSDWQEEHRISMDGPVQKIAFSPYADLLVTGDPRFMRVFSVPAWSEAFRSDHPRGVSGIGFSSDGKYLAAAAHEKDAHVWEIPSFKEVLSLSLGEKILSLAVAPVLNWVALGGEETMKLFNLETGQQTSVFEQKRPVYSLVFSLYGRYMAAGESDNVVVYDLEENGREAARRFVSCPVTGLDFSQATGALAVVGSDVSVDEISIFDTTRLNITVAPPPPPPAEPLKAGIIGVIDPVKIQINMGKRDGVREGKKGFIFDTVTGFDGKSEMMKIADVVVLSADESTAVCQIKGDSLDFLFNEYGVAFPQ
ncbi:MAG: hypothetical protein M1269_05840 [Chloroflexi bacterium]|nr:hypothetical protein [Chloroflexota bacterium]